jgi:hypothetical protein
MLCYFMLCIRLSLAVHPSLNDIVVSSFGQIDMVMVPGFGLYLDELFFDGYNNKQAQDAEIIRNANARKIAKVAPSNAPKEGDEAENGHPGALDSPAVAVNPADMDSTIVKEKIEWSSHATINDSMKSFREQAIWNHVFEQVCVSWQGCQQYVPMMRGILYEHCPSSYALCLSGICYSRVYGLFGLLAGLPPQLSCQGDRRGVLVQVTRLWSHVSCLLPTQSPGTRTRRIVTAMLVRKDAQRLKHWTHWKRASSTLNLIYVLFLRASTTTCVSIPAQIQRACTTCGIGRSYQCNGDFFTEGQAPIPSRIARFSGLVDPPHFHVVYPKFGASRK